LLGLDLGCGDGCPRGGTQHCGMSAQCVGEDEVERIVRDYVYKEHPKMGPGVTFDVSEFDVSNLWQEMNIQIFYVKFLSSDGQWFNEKAFVYHDGIVEPFICMPAFEVGSAAVSAGALYYTFAWGEMPRSQVAKLWWNEGDCTLKVLESVGFPWEFVVVYRRGSEIWVGKDPQGYSAFNTWESVTPLGRIEERNGTLAIVDEKGNVAEKDFCEPDFPCY
jgi:hypothetical protein